MSQAENELSEATKNDLKRLRDEAEQVNDKLLQVLKKRRRSRSLFSSSSEEEEEEAEEASSPARESDEETIGSRTTSSSVDSDDNEEEEEDEATQRNKRMELARKQDDFMDEWFDCEIPASFDENADIFLVATAETLPEDTPVVPERYKSFARDLYAYDTGVTVIKKYAPWGVASALRSEGFLVKKKIYSPQGEIAFVLLKNLYGAEQSVLVGPELFGGWVDEYASHFL